MAILGHGWLGRIISVSYLTSALCVIGMKGLPKSPESGPSGKTFAIPEGPHGGLA